ncbi:MAG: trypsin-like peptidase domain-containing protein [Oscillospiraceae bacterium]|nr:trypsin-like peptidase domain-containing protein [Oscillospiraceae bacterium]
MENEEDTAKVGNFIVTDTISDIESKADENGLVHWSDILGYGLDAVKNELAENPPAEPVTHNENRRNLYGDESVTVSIKEEFKGTESNVGSYKSCAPEETRYILDRLLEIKEPEDSIVFDHGDIYLDIRWRGKTISSEGFPSYMPYEDASASANPLSLDPYSRAKVSAPSTAPAKYIAEILVYYNDGANIYRGTAFFVGKNILLTAGHVLYKPEYGTPDKVEIYPGGFESGLPKKVSYRAIPSDGAIANYDPYSNDPDDYGVIYVTADVSDGYFGLSTTSNSTLDDAYVHLYGFPKDKPISSSNGLHNEFWVSHGYTDSSPQPKYLLHTAYSVPGCSGGPLILDSNQKVIAINSGEYGGNQNYLYSVRITSTIIQFVNKYR